jgi:hypothetical protein
MAGLSYVMGLDLGQPGEPTGFAVLEWPATDDPKPEMEYHLRHLERFQPGTQYQTIIESVAERTDKPPLTGSPIVVDVTAVGRQIVDRLYKSLKRVQPIVIGAGHTPQWVERIGQMVPKKELVTGLQLALQSRRLKVAPDLPDTELLAKELSNFRLQRVSISEADAAEWRVNRNDDLVFAVALACWHADQYPPRKPLPLRPPPEPRDWRSRLFGGRSVATNRLFGR